MATGTRSARNCPDMGEPAATWELDTIQRMSKRFDMRGTLSVIESRALLNLARTVALRNESRTRGEADFGGKRALCVVCQYPMPEHGTVCAGGPEPEMCPMAQFIR